MAAALTTQRRAALANVGATATLRDMPRSRSQQAPHVLIADDQPDVLNALRLLLRNEGFVVTVASSPAGVRSAVGTASFDAVLIDLNYTRDTTSGREGLARISHRPSDGSRFLGRLDLERCGQPAACARSSARVFQRQRCVALRESGSVIVRSVSFWFVERLSAPQRSGYGRRR